MQKATPFDPARGRLRRTRDALAVALCTLHRVQFDAPWKQRGKGC